MKMHSYMTVNGYLQSVDAQARSALAELHRLAKQENGGWDDALSTAQSHRAELNAKGTSSDLLTIPEDTVTPMEAPSNISTPTLGTSRIEADGSTKSYIDAKAAATLRQRLVVAAAVEGKVPSDRGQEATPQPTPPLPTGTTHPHAGGPGAPGLHPLVDHPSERISSVARDYSEMQAELTSSGPLYVRWPENISWKNFAVYQLIPTLVYELEYPRTDR